MNRAGIGGRRHGRRAPTSFSLIELLVVMTIIAILMALILAAGIGLLNTGARSRARAEIQAMSSAAESYKIDNGIYPQSDSAGALQTNNYANSDGNHTPYQTNGTLLYIALSGQNNFATVPAAGSKVYMSFKINQVGNPNGTYSYVMDPWTYSYGYSTAQGAAYTPYSGSNFFDLWSTGGLPYTKVNTNTWLRNWAQ